MTNQYLNNLYRDLLSNSPQTVTIDIPADMGTGQISQIVTKQGAVVSDWKMNYFSDINVQGVNSEEYIQILFCFNDGVSWNIADNRQSTSIQKGESCIYRGHGKMEYMCYTGNRDFLFKNIKIPLSFFYKILNDYFEDSEIDAYEEKLLTGISKVSIMFKKIFEYAGPYKKNMYVATVVVLVSVLMGVLPFVLAYQVIAPLVMGDTIDASFIILRVILVFVCLVLQAILYGWGLNISHKAAYDTLLRLRTALQKRFEKLPLGVIQDKGTGTVKKLFVDDVDSLEVLLAHSMPEGIANLMIPIAVYVAMFFVDWKLALLSLASIPISLIAMMTMYSVGMKKMGPYYMAGQKMNNTIIEYINGMEVVKVFNKDADSYERFRKDVSDYRDYTLAWYKAAWPWMAIYSSLLPCTIILTLPLGAWFVLSGWSALPDLILILCLSLSIGMPLLKSLGFLPTMPQLNYKISALEQVLDAPELRQTDDGFHGKDNTIAYDHVSFAYQTMQPGPDGKPMVVEDEVLHDISFVAKSGQKTALVGESGSGKSTLAKLLIHYYDPQKGSISIGGQNLSDMSLEALNSRISYVAQDQYLFNTSLLENIRLGRLNATDEEVMEAARKAQCIELLEKLPQGIHSMAGDAGKMLSGGQRQRISLARAILKNAPIVVLDEATAYADPENEEKMEAAIAELVKGKTLVVIAHKLPAIMNADQICVMDHGKMVATGRHQELIQCCPEYQKLWKAAQDSAEWKVHTAKEGK